MWISSLVVGCGIGSIPLDNPQYGDLSDAPIIQAEQAPPPRLVGPPLAVFAIPGGYRMVLNRRTTDDLLAALERTDETQVAAKLRDLAKDKRAGEKPDEDTAAKLDLAAFLVSSQVPAFRKALGENVGPGGVRITVTGLQTPTIKFRKPRPRLEKAAELIRESLPLMPDEAREAVEALRAVGRTTPLFWKVEPRE